MEMSEEKKKGRHGGARQGAGRPSKNRGRTLCVPVSEETLRKLKSTGASLADTIEKLAESL